MASTRLKSTKAGKQYYEIRVRVSRDRPELSTRWYIPDGWSKRAVERELAKVSAEFERQCMAGEVLSRKEVQRKAAQEAQAAAAILTVKKYGETVFMPSKTVTCSENTRAFYQAQLDKHVYPVIGSLQLPEVNPAQISALLLELQKSGKAHSSVIAVYTTLHQLFKAAYMSDLIGKNPMDKVQRPRQTKDKLKASTVEAYTAEELRHIIECLDNEPLKWRAYVRLLIDSGMRRGEACALKWENVSFRDNTITICENLCYTKEKGVYLDTPKSGKARTIDIDPDVMALLKAMRAQQSKQVISKFVFTKDNSPDPMHPQSPTRYLARFSERYGIEGLHPHKLRHSFASVAITNNADIASVSEKLGHADKGTTLKMYTHADSESIKRAGNVFRDALRNQKQA
jgi:integrase